MVLDLWPQVMAFSLLCLGFLHVYTCIILEIQYIYQLYGVCIYIIYLVFILNKILKLMQISLIVIILFFIYNVE